MVVKHIQTDGEYAQAMAAGAGKVLVIDFFATWCGPCKNIAPLFEQLSMRYPAAVFLKVDVDKCASTAQNEGVTAMPTFVFYSDKVKVEMMRGANPQELEQKVRHWAETAAAQAGREPCPVPGQSDLLAHLDKGRMECLNEDNKCTMRNLFDNNGPLKSDADEQLILNVPFHQPMKIHSLRFKGPKDSGPKTVKIFINNPLTIDFDAAEKSEAVQTINLSSADVENGVIHELRYVRFQSVGNIQFFIVDNQTGTECTQLDALGIYGTPVTAATNMNDLKRVAGKAGESH